MESWLTVPTLAKAAYKYCGLENVFAVDPLADRPEVILPKGTKVTSCILYEGDHPFYDPELTPFIATTEDGNYYYVTLPMGAITFFQRPSNMFRRTLLRRFPILKTILAGGDVIILGDAVREPFDATNIEIAVAMADPDFYRDLEKTYPLTFNKFGGFKIKTDAFSADIWSFYDTFAWHDVERFPFPSSSNLINTVFYNYDGIMYDWSTSRFITTHYDQLLLTQELDIVYEKTPFPVDEIARGIVIAKREGFDFSQKLKTFIKLQVDRKIVTPEKLYEYQIHHYGEEICSLQEFKDAI